MSREDGILSSVHPKLVEAFHLIREHYHELFSTHTLKVTEGHRSVERQQDLYAQGRTKPGSIVTHIDGIKKKGKHNHLPSLAIDVAVIDRTTKKATWDDEYYRCLVGLADVASKEVGAKIVSGGSWKSFKDYPHLEIHV